MRLDSKIYQAQSIVNVRPDLLLGVGMLRFEEVIDIYVEDNPKSPISKIQSNLILILKAFFKRKLINRPQCEILLQKIKSLQEVQNIEDVLKQASLPAQQKKKQSQSEKKKAKKRQNLRDISIDDGIQMKVK
ncbi:Hypothetical_protein [Hexamita inflata]|uniref:Hypothetical_protein n=1 Tax=Hexamita inflata TaxID=28002 RepID=A0AA86RQN9_9EUKA|nr:Hypothetical protein HINF_LOCUS65513 [Hexamita inflata]